MDIKSHDAALLTGENRIKSQCHLVNQKSHMDWPGLNSGLRGEGQATNRLRHDTAKYACDLDEILATEAFGSYRTVCSLKLWSDVRYN